ncbi:hypothetical protein ONZ45_g3783 [Pleurotus djamor]|nr:hypothetical protein ONZ45_g15770 [Pleurotus djamor]KAJ8519252.1 hypothetical protein ONZ45_g3783 [Pleurotus djamor]
MPGVPSQHQAPRPNDLNMADSAEGRLSFISSLPNELLIEIFLASGTLPTEGVPAPLVLSQVSRRWRYLTLTSPILWTRLDISHHSLPLLKLSIARSKPCLLDVVVRVDDPDSPHRHMLRQAFDLIVPEIHRLRRLVIDARFFSSVLLVYMMLHLQYAPRLEHFSMSLSDPFGLEESWREPENTFLDILAGGAPMLSSFHLWGISLHYCHPPLRFLKRLFLTTPFDSETSLPISNVKLRNILGSLSRLESLGLHGRILSLPLTPNDHENPISLPQLSVLDISAPSDESGVTQCDYIKSICSTISAPNLHHLWVNFLGTVYSPPFLQSIRVESPDDLPILSEAHDRSEPRKHFSVDVSLGEVSPPPTAHPFLPSFDPAQLEDILLSRTMIAIHKDWSELRLIEATGVDEYRLFRILGMSDILGNHRTKTAERDAKCGNSVRSITICNSGLPLDKQGWVREQVEAW